MRRQRRRFPRAFRLETVRMVKNGVPAAEVARNLRIPMSVLRAWQYEFVTVMRRDAASRPVVASASRGDALCMHCRFQREVGRLRRQLRIVEKAARAVAGELR
ncbi:MAG: transposase [Gemmatimonadaceae bacterium]|nr:transposase [Gemmatimonadaceae bacterium]